MFVDRRCLVLAVVISVPVVLDSFQAGSPAQNLLAGAKGVKCEFAVLATGTWEDGEAKADVKESRLSIAFESIDTGDGFATAVGAFGPSNIIVRFSAGNLHLMQIGTSGAVYVTTIFSVETRDGRLQAVHTRHEYTEVSMPGFTSRPEQYYGECQIGQNDAL